MNELSWMIYAADVAADTNAVCGFVFYAGCVGLAIYGLAKVICRLANDGYGEDPVTPSIAKATKTLAPFVIAAGLVGVVVPGKDTFYAIAASEMGERVLTSETGGKAVQALDAWLDRQIAGKPSEPAR